jgi:hypothetical protein
MPAGRVLIGDILYKVELIPEKKLETHLVAAGPGGAPFANAIECRGLSVSVLV